MTLSRRRFLGAAAGIAVGALGAGAVELSRFAASTPLRPHYRAIVVGSGYGGGVSALRPSRGFVPPSARKSCTVSR